MSFKQLESFVDSVQKDKEGSKSPHALGVAHGWLDRNKIKVVGLDNAQLPGRESATLADIEDRYLMDVMHMIQGKGNGLTESILKKGLTQAFNERFDEFKKQYVNKIQFTREKEVKGKEELTTWLKLLIGKMPQQKHVAIMQHFLWQVIRKMNNKKVTWHMMPVLVGPQGGGKSEAVGRLIAPLSELVATGQSVDFIEKHETAYPLLANNLIVPLDEMSKANRTDVNKLKSVISLEELNYRIYHSQKFKKVKNLATFIGTSNEMLADQIKDSTGMRRFAEIRTADNRKLPESEREKIWEQINSINYQLIWESVDPKKDEPYIIPYLDEITDDQESLRTKDAVEWFIEEKGIEPLEGAELPGTQLYQIFKTYCEESGLKHTLTRQNFYRKLEERGIARSASSTTRSVMFDCRISAPITTATVMNLGSIK